MSKKIENLSKGDKAEEILRYYFRGLGFYVVRGVKVNHKNVDITDIDLLLYNKNSSFSREWINVDIKDKKSPHAVERIFWTKGIQNNLGLDKCIVATSDSRPEVTEYGKKQDVVVLDGNFLSELKEKDFKIKRVSEEFLKEQLDNEDLKKFLGDWWRRYERSKSRLIFDLNFTGFNQCLEDINELFQEVIARPNKSGYYLRFLYLIVSHSLVIIDYLIGSVPFMNQDEKQEMLDEGFKHGSHGKAKTDHIMTIVSKLVSGYVKDGEKITKQIRQDLNSTSDDIPTEILSEFFSNTSNTNYLFEHAKKFELLGFQKEVAHPNSLDNGLKSLLGLYLDFCQISRKDFFEIDPN
ncbi:hypothetical protein [Fodinibius sp. AD559]|uniref:hypothetical protein n=1 Tax=Fodinibius sp. AD559 TaxID=3424179 RepID=UPI0040469854